MSENRMLTDGEIKRLAESQAEREAFVKSTVVFIVIWVVGFVTLAIIPDATYRLLGFLVSLRVVYFIISFIVAFVAGLITRWLVKSSAYDKYFALYAEQQKPMAKDKTLLE